MDLKNGKQNIYFFTKLFLISKDMKSKSVKGLVVRFILATKKR